MPYRARRGIRLQVPIDVFYGLSYSGVVGASESEAHKSQCRRTVGMRIFLDQPFLNLARAILTWRGKTNIVLVKKCPFFDAIIPTVRDHGKIFCNGVLAHYPREFRSCEQRGNFNSESVRGIPSV